MTEKINAQRLKEAIACRPKNASDIEDIEETKYKALETLLTLYERHGEQAIASLLAGESWCAPMKPPEIKFKAGEMELACNKPKGIEIYWDAVRNWAMRPTTGEEND